MKKLKSVSCILLAVMLCVSMLQIDVVAGSNNKTKISNQKISIGVGMTTKLSIKQGSTAVKKVKWKSSNKKVATINSKGKIKAKKTGKATITAKVGKKSYKCKVTVTKTHVHKYKKVIDEKAWDEYEEVPVYKTVWETHWYLLDGTDCTDWTAQDKSAWCKQHCTWCYTANGLDPADCPDPRYVVSDGVLRSVCATQCKGTAVAVEVQTGTKKVLKKHHKEVSHYECKTCGAIKN